MASFLVAEKLIAVPYCDLCNGTGLATSDFWISDTSKCEGCNGARIKLSDIKKIIPENKVHLCIGCNNKLTYQRNYHIFEGSNIKLSFSDEKEVKGIFKYNNIYHLCCDSCIKSRNDRRLKANRAFWQGEALRVEMGNLYMFSKEDIHMF